MKVPFSLSSTAALHYAATPNLLYPPVCVCSTWILKKLIYEKRQKKKATETLSASSGFRRSTTRSNITTPRFVTLTQNIHHNENLCSESDQRAVSNQNRINDHNPGSHNNKRNFQSSFGWENRARKRPQSAIQCD